MKKSVVVYVHIIFWVVVIVSRFITVPVIGLNHFSPEELGSVMIVIKLIDPLFFYVGYVGIMRIKWKKSYVAYIIIGAILVFLVLFLTFKKVFFYGIISLSSVTLWLAIGCLFKFFIDWFKKKNDILVLEKENAVSKVALLQSQVNPHFLFNTLHNIDTLIHNNQEKASQSLVKLSDIMRYMLKDAKTDFVELKNEIEYLENYFSLEKIRLKNESFLNYNINGNCNDFKIAPMILIPFVENAFKHAVDSNIKDGIIIKIAIENRTLNFYCENHYDKSESEKDKTHGIGLDTVKKRLDLIYKNRYKLKINSENSVFKVNLEIQLNED